MFAEKDNNDTEQIVGIDFDVIDYRALIQRLVLGIENNRKRVVFFVNPHSVVESWNDPGFKQALHSADFILADGVGIVIASRLLKGKIKKRVHGPQLFLEITNHINNEGRQWKYFFLGSTDEVLADMKKRMKVEFPNVKVVGSYSPSFGKLSEDELISAWSKGTVNKLWSLKVTLYVRKT